MRRWSWMVALLVTALLGASSVRAIPPEERTQFVLLGFDTTPGPRRPVERTEYHALIRAINQRTPPGAPRNGYTMFLISGGMQLDPQRRVPVTDQPFLGVLPRNRPVVHYASDMARVRDKVENIRELEQAGVEFGSHAVRHDHGRSWDLSRWRHELTDHNRIMELYGLSRPVGFRAPFLEWNEHLYAAMRELGYQYDVSQGGPPAWPSRHPSSGLWLFTIPTVRVPGSSAPVLYFDDNMQRALGTMARQRGLRGAAASEWMDEAFVQTSLDAFYRRYRGNRAPMVIGGHGSFRMATIRFMRNICYLPHVRCATFREAVRYLEEHPELEGEPPLRGQMAGGSAEAPSRHAVR